MAIAACAGVTQETCQSRALLAQNAAVGGAEQAVILYDGGIINKDSLEKAYKVTKASNSAASTAYYLCPLDERNAVSYIEKAGALMLEFNTIVGD